MFELILETTPDTTNYMIGGYGIFFAVMILYLASLVVRQRNLRQDLDSLHEMNEE